MVGLGLRAGRPQHSASRIPSSLLDADHMLAQCCASLAQQNLPAGSCTNKSPLRIVGDAVTLQILPPIPPPPPPQISPIRPHKTFSTPPTKTLQTPQGPANPKPTSSPASGLRGPGQPRRTRARRTRGRPRIPIDNLELFYEPLGCLHFKKTADFPRRPQQA